MGALLRENIGGAFDSLSLPPAAQRSGTQDQNAASGCLRLQLPDESSIGLPLQGRFALRRFELAGFPQHNLRTTCRDLDDPRVLLEALDASGFGTNVSGDWQGLRLAFLDSTATLFLDMLLRKAAAGAHALPTPEQLSAMAPDRVLIWFEQWSILGHQLHPTPKARLDLSLSQNETYAPANRAQFSVPILALRRSCAEIMRSGSVAEDEHFWMGTPLRLAAERAALDRKLDPHEWIFLPMHPLQPKLRPTLSAHNMDLPLVSLGEEVSLSGTPTIAFRTIFAPEQNYYLKLPLDVVLTSARRTLSVKPCHNGLVIARVLADIAARNDVPSSFIFQRELLSVRLAERFYDHKHVSFIVRESCSHLLDEGALPMPAAALFEASPWHRDRKILDDILALRSHPPGRQTAYDFFREYTELVVPPCLRILTKYGLGLEAHLQNSILVFVCGRPSRFIYRDNDAISVCTERLRRQSSLVGEFLPNSWNVAPTPEGAQDKLRHSLFHAHISELIVHLSSSYAMEEEVLWQTLAILIERTLKHLATEEGLGRFAAEDMRFFFSKNTEAKSLAKMKLLNRKNDYVFTTMANPLRLPKAAQ